MPLREDLLNPIPGPNPAGVNLRYDPLYDKIKEALREDDDAPQGAWERVRKTADLPLTIKLCSDALATKSKDLQIAAWLTEALVRREGFAPLPACLRLLKGLVEQFWEGLYPELEDGDADLRAGPLDSLSAKLSKQLKLAPITKKYSWMLYKESRQVGPEDPNASDAAKQKRQALIKEGRITAEEFNQDAAATPATVYLKLYADFTDDLTILAELSELCDEKFGDASPSFIKLREVLEELQTTVRVVAKELGISVDAPVAAPEPEPEPEPVAAPAAAPVIVQPVVQAPAATATVAAAAAAAPARALEPAAPSAAPASPADAHQRVFQVAAYLRQQDSYDIAPFLLVRSVRWAELRYNGADIPAEMLLAPPPAARATFAQLLQRNDGDAILSATESAMVEPYSRAWLDLQRYTVRGLQAKGGWYGGYMASWMRTQLRALLMDLPNLLDLTLSDGSPTADAETRAWIENEVLAGAALPTAAAIAPTPAEPTPAPAPTPEPEPEPPAPVTRPVAEQPVFQPLAATPEMEQDPQPPGDEPPPPDAFELAKAASQEGKPRQALTILSQQLARERSGRGRFRRRMQIASLCIEHGQENIAYPILQELAQEIEQRQLDTWETGDVLAHPLVLLLRCRESSGLTDEQRRALYARICRIDPLQALNCAL